MPNYSYIYVKTLGKITSLYILGDVAACRRAACVLCAVQSETDFALQTTNMPLYDMLPHQLIYITT